MNKKVLITLLAFVLIAAGSWTAIRFAKGYRPNLKEKTISPNGLLVANSFPTGASVYLNNKLSTATDNTLHLPPKDYLVKIIKDGYLEWQKNLQVKKELVSQTNAELFKSAPDLQSLSSTGAINPLPSPDGLKVVFAVASASASKNGLWVLNMQNKTFSFASNLKQIALHSQKYDFAQAGFFWTPNSKQILAVFKNNNILLDAEKMTNIGDYKDVTAQLPLLIKEWQQELNKKRSEQWAKLPPEMQDVASNSAKLVFFSPDEETMLYTATASATIKENLIPPLLASSTQPQERQLKANRVYIYDLIEDKNFFIKPAKEEKIELPNMLQKLSPELLTLQKQYSPLFFQKTQWYPSSRHLIWLEQGKINIVEHDGNNKLAVYNGPFEDGFVYPWPDGSKLLVLTNLNKDIPSTNLYGVGIK